MTVTITRRGSVEWITLDRPDRLNALDEPTRLDLAAALRSAAHDAAVRCVVLTGAGRAFCVGQDLGARHELIDAEATVRDTYNPLVAEITTMDKPVVAAVNGLAVGAGMGLALVCDLVLAADTAAFACSFGKVGLVPDTGVSHVLVRRLGHAAAFDLATTGRSLTAQDARDLGLITAVIAGDELTAEAQRRAEALASGPATAFALTKRLFHLAGHASLPEVLAAEAAAQGEAAGSADHAEGLEAFHAKRRPEFTSS